jgi:DNA polymerase-3 subunit gamma/tau
MAKHRKPTSDSPKPAEGYTVLARRYRPQQFKDVVGQEAVARALVNALESNRVAHAYLFTGARGVGKTSMARILAKALNCVRGPTATPCDECEICRSVAGGDDVDVLEIDAASNRGIDEVREIRANVQYRPSRSRYKIYIIDEVHMLTREAFNALLKTLEEPPPHVKFIFATTEVQRIPVTILSRCQRFDFGGIGTARITERLRQIVADEEMAADDEALELVARRAAGSMRDAQSLLDQLLAFGEGQAGRLTVDRVHELLGTAHDDRVLALATAVLEHDPKTALEFLGEAAAQGLHLGEFLDQLIEYWRDLMIVHCAGPDGRDLSVPPRHRDTLARQAAALGLDTILAGLDILAATKARLRGSAHARVLIEMALVRLGRLDDLVSLSQLADWLAGGGGHGQRPASRQPTAASGPNAADGERRGPVNARTPPPAPPAPGLRASAEAAPRAVSPAPAPAGPTPISEASLRRIWADVLAQVGPMLGTNLEKAEGVAISGPNHLVIRFGAGYNFQREHCQQPTCIARVEEALKKVTGQVWGLRVESGRDVTSATPPPTNDTENSPSRYRRQRTEAMQEPLVKRAMERLGAQIVHVDDGFGIAPPEGPERPETTEDMES